MSPQDSCSPAGVLPPSLLVFFRVSFWGCTFVEPLQSRSCKQQRAFTYEHRLVLAVDRPVYQYATQGELLRVSASHCRRRVLLRVLRRPLFCRVKCFCFWTVRALCKCVVRQRIEKLSRLPFLVCRLWAQGQDFLGILLVVVRSAWFSWYRRCV